MLLQRGQVAVAQGAAAGGRIVPAVFARPAAHKASSSHSVLPSLASQQACSVSSASRRVVVAHGAANSSLQLPIDLDLEQPLPGFDTIESALADLAAGKLVVVLDDEDRENEGDLIMNADKITTETMAFLVEYTSGVVCISMEGHDLDRLRLPLMVSSAENEESMYTAFTITVDLKEGITTGISASDRAKTIRRLADPSAVAGDFRRPGHIFPLRYRPGGVIVRPGHTEAALDLARLSGSYPAGVLCEVVNKEDGSMSRTPQLRAFAKEHGMKCITIADLIRYRLRHDGLVKEVGSPVKLATSQGVSVRAHCFRSLVDGVEHLALVHGDAIDAAHGANVLVHVCQERTVADLLDCSPAGPSGALASPTLDAALRSVQQAGAGVVVYLRGQTARGVGLAAELQALADHGEGGANGAASSSGTSLDLKEVALAAQMLKSLGVSSVALAGGDAQLLTALRSCGVAVQPAACCNGSSANGNGAAHHAGSNGVNVQRPLAAGRV